MEYVWTYRRALELLLRPTAVCRLGERRVQVLEEGDKLRTVLQPEPLHHAGQVHGVAQDVDVGVRRVASLRGRELQRTSGGC